MTQVWELCALARTRGFPIGPPFLLPISLSSPRPGVSWLPASRFRMPACQEHSTGRYMSERVPAAPLPLRLVRACTAETAQLHAHANSQGVTAFE